MVCYRIANKVKALKFTVFVYALAKVKTENNDDKIQVFFTTNVLLPSYDFFESHMSVLDVFIS